MSSVLDSQEGESSMTLDGSSDLAIDSPGLELLESELEVSVPRQSISPSSLTKPVTDNVMGSGVDENRKTLLQHEGHVSLSRSEGVSSGVVEVGDVI